MLLLCSVHGVSSLCVCACENGTLICGNTYGFKGRMNVCHASNCEFL